MKKEVSFFKKNMAVCYNLELSANFDTFEWEWEEGIEMT